MSVQKHKQPKNSWGSALGDEDLGGNINWIQVPVYKNPELIKLEGAKLTASRTKANSSGVCMLYMYYVCIFVLTNINTMFYTNLIYNANVW